MSDQKCKPDPKFKCDKCDKPYVKKGAMTNHKLKVHNITKSPLKTGFMDLSSNSEHDKNIHDNGKYPCLICDMTFKSKKSVLGHMQNIHKKNASTIFEVTESDADIDEFELEKTMMTEYAQELNLREDTEELELVSNMTSTINFNSSVLVSSLETEKTNNVIKILSDTGKPITGEVLPKGRVPLCSPAAKFLTESQKKIVIPDFTESEDDDEEEISICGECGKSFSNEEEGNIHMRVAHKKKMSDKTNHTAGDHKCTECHYRTNFAVHFYQHCLDHHTPKELDNIINKEKSPIIFMLAEHNMALAEETKSLKRDLDYIKEALRPKNPSTKFKCQKCNELSSSPTRIQEHILADHCCKYCEKSFSSKTEKARHMKYMCIVCEKTFGHNLELHIHTKTFHKQDNKSQSSKNKKSIPHEEEQILHDLPYKCTECKYQQESRDELIKHIETNHASILSPAKISRPVPAPRRLRFKCTECNHREKTEADTIRHIESVHANILIHGKVHQKRTLPTSEPDFMVEDNHTLYKCDKCKHSATSNQNLSHHKKVEHGRYTNLPNWFLVGDSHLNTLNNREVEKATKGRLFCPGFVRPKEGRAYCSTKDWPNAKFPDNSHTEIIPKILSDRKYEGGIVLCPTNDITNTKTFPQAQQYTMAERSAKNMVSIAEKALRDNKTLMKIVLMEYPTRADRSQLNFRLFICFF